MREDTSMEFGQHCPARYVYTARQGEFVGSGLANHTMPA